MPRHSRLFQSRTDDTRIKIIHPQRFSGLAVEYPLAVSVPRFVRFQGFPNNGQEWEALFSCFSLCFIFLPLPNRPFDI